MGMSMSAHTLRLWPPMAHGEWEICREQLRAVHSVLFTCVKWLPEQKKPKNCSHILLMDLKRLAACRSYPRELLYLLKHITKS